MKIPSNAILEEPIRGDTPIKRLPVEEQEESETVAGDSDGRDASS